RSLARISRSIGRNATINELRWMTESLSQPVPQINPSAGVAPLNLEVMLRRRATGEPLQYILGTQPFGLLDLLVEPPTLIPRPETEEWSLWLSEILRGDLASESKRTDMRPLRLLDICTGTGCIPLLLCSELPAGSLHALGVDISPNAVKLANANRGRCSIAPGSEFANPTPHRQQNTFQAIQSDLFSSKFLSDIKAPSASNNVSPGFDILTSNPPYITPEEYDELPREVRDYEDPRALLGEAPSKSRDGLAFYQRIANLIS
ncbi:S-adenosyl-L-methionine-dependent methyltransferase, partial [Clavulina sp. PMI_390]